MEKNQAIGLALISAIMMGYFIYFGNQEEQYKASEKTTTQQVESKTNPTTPSTPAVVDTAQLQKKFGGFAAAAQGESKEESLSNSDITVTFNSHGGKIEKVLLKKYLTDDKKPLYIIDQKSSKMDFVLPTNSGNINLSDLYYVPSKSDSSISYRATLGANQYIEHSYILPKEGYVVKYDLKLVGLDSEIKNENVDFNWEAHLPKVEKDIEVSRTSFTINYYMANGDFDYLSEKSKDKESEALDNPVKWISMKQKFFTSSIIAQNNNFTSGIVRSEVLGLDTTSVKDLTANLKIPAHDLKSGKGNFLFYFGPNKYDVLKEVTEGFGKNLFLGWPGINFINRFIVIPAFGFLEGFISNYGVIIIVLVLLLKLILFPLSFKSYISMAKMKVLKPEIDEIKERAGGDMQKSQVETMDLYRKVGINPLSGCIPVLLQMPILLAMFNFFPNAIELRQEAFLWAPDLSTYDSIYSWSSEIPLISKFYGNHISLFTILMTISTIVYTWFNNQVSTVTGPMKTVSYVMPVVFMFVLNSFPAGLSFYYFVSNLVTIAQQIIIRKFVDEDQIRKTLDENKKKSATTPNKKSRWMQRMEDAMKAKEDASKKKKK